MRMSSPEDTGGRGRLLDQDLRNRLGRGSPSSPGDSGAVRFIIYVMYLYVL